MDPSKHSDLPYWLRMHGSVLPKMVLPLLFVAGWASAVTLISEFVYDCEHLLKANNDASANVMSSGNIKHTSYGFGFRRRFIS